MGKSKKGRGCIDSSVIRWSDDSTPASRFVTEHDLPQVVKLHTGNYGNLSCGSEIDVTQPLLLHTARQQCEKVVGQMVRWDGGRGRYMDTDTQIIIPTNYPGWFSLRHDQDSPPLRPWTSLREVPVSGDRTVLATRPLTCFMLSEGATVGEKVHLNTDCGAGQVFEVGDLYVERTTRTTPTCCLTWLIGGKTSQQTTEEIEYLLCEDSQDHTRLLIPRCVRGGFYRVEGGKGSEGGLSRDTVYRVCDIIERGDLPCYVQLVHGISPTNMNLSTSVIRLEGVCEEDTVIACSLQASQFSFLEFPLDTDIELIHTNNNRELLNQPYIQDALQYCSEQITSYIVSLKVIQNIAPVKHKKKDKPKHSAKRPLISGPILSDSSLEQFASQGQDVGNIRQSLRLGDVFPHVQNVDSCPGHSIPDVVSQCTEDFTDDDSIQIGPESHYETIPCDKNRHKPSNVDDVQQTHIKPPIEMEDQGLPEDLDPIEAPRPRRHSEVIPESEYLVPLHLRKQSVYSNLPVTQPGQCEALVFDPGAILHTSSVTEGDVGTPRRSVLTHLPPGGGDRMDRFLQDSLEELNRSRQTQEPRVEEDTHQRAGTNPIQEDPDASGMKAKLDAFLDEIFDYDNLEKGKVSENLEHVVKLSEPSRDRDISLLHTYPMQNKSMSASELYDKSVTAFNDGQNTAIDKPLNISSKSESNSSTSASSIYRQMKRAHYGRAESYHTDSPYHRTDSGIVLSPRYSASEMGYNRDIYQAMSDVAWSPPEDLSSLSVEEVGLSLIYIGIKQLHVDQFMDQQIDGEQLMSIDDTLLKEAFPELNGLERKKIVDFVYGWRPKKMACH